MTQDASDQTKPTDSQDSAKNEEKNVMPIAERFQYAAGVIGIQFGGWGVKGLSKPVYSIMLGVSPAMVGTLLALTRVWDALWDPLMGSISDRTRSRWGRRRPYIFVGSILVGLMYPLVWFASDGWSETAKATYLGVALAIFYMAYTVYSVPYYALGNELSPHQVERTKALGIRAMVGVIPGFFIIWIVPAAFYLAEISALPDATTGVRLFTAVLGVGMAALGILAAVKTKERYFKVAAKTKKDNPWHSARDFLKDLTFWKFKGIIICMLVAGDLPQFLGLYLNVYYVAEGDKTFGTTLSALGGNVGTATNLLVQFVLIKYLVARFDKLVLLKATLLISILTDFTKWFLINPDYPYLTVLNSFLNQPTIAAFWLITSAMGPDYLDHQELKHGKRREGMLGSVSSWLHKFSSSLAVAGSGFVLLWVGFVDEQHENQSPETFFWMRVLFIVIPVVFYSIALLLVYVYPLTRERVEEMHVELKARRGEVE